MFPRHEAAFTAWLQARIAGATDLRVERAKQLTFGHSNQTWDIAVRWIADGQLREDRYILRAPPEGIGLLEPYDVAKQYHVMQALGGSGVPVPKMLWLDDSNEVLGRPFFLMERLDGFSIEWNLPGDIAAATAEQVRAICEQYIDAVAAVHMVDWRAVETHLPAPSADPIGSEIDWWEAKVQGHHGESLPSFERVVAWLRTNHPGPVPPRIVHGDPKLGNLLLRDARLIALLDWELSSIGDPMCDLGWMSFQWSGPFTAGFADLPGAMTWDELAARYTAKTGIPVDNIRYYQVLQGFKAAAICFIGYMMFLQGTSSDPRFEQFGPVVPPQLDMMLALMGEGRMAHGAVLDRLL